MGIGVSTVNLSTTDNDEQILYKISLIDLKYICVDNIGLKKIFNIKKNHAVGIQYIICLDKPDDVDLKILLELDLFLITFKDYKRFDTDFVSTPIDAESVSMLAFSSGTTGNPKLYKITHKCVMETLASILYKSYKITSNDVYNLSSPYNDFNQKIICYLAMISGAGIGISSFSMDDLMVLRPTILFVYPRTLDYLYLLSLDELKSLSNTSRQIFNKTFSKKLKQITKGIKPTKSIWDKIPFSPIRKNFGKKVRLIFTGSSIVNPDTLNFFNIVLGCDIIEYYGVAECADFNLCSGNTRLEHIGGPLASSDIRIAYVNDLLLEGIEGSKYGELHISRSCAPLEYDKDRIDEDWVRTGDVFRVLDGVKAFYFIDRLDYIMKVRSGWSVAPQRLELAYKQCPLVSQIVVYTDIRLDFLIAVVVPNEINVLKFWPNKTVSFSWICLDQGFKKTLAGKLLELAGSKGLRSYEYIKEIIIEPVPWTGQEYTTSNLKLKRHVIIDKYRPDIENLIQSISL